MMLRIAGAGSLGKTLEYPGHLAESGEVPLPGTMGAGSPSGEGGRLATSSAKKDHSLGRCLLRLRKFGDDVGRS
jgi:hypothetical protein